MKNRNRLPILLLSGLGMFAIAHTAWAQTSSDARHEPNVVTCFGDYSGIKNVTLEMSLKPFRKLDEPFIRANARELFRQWWPLTRHAEMVSVLLWTADGSEILDYQGDLDQPIEWARYIGGANSKYEPGTGPKHLTLHQRPFYYRKDPPTIRYTDLKRIARILKEVGREETRKPVRIGATFDPGPEFAKSEFKYKRHPEVCMGGTMGKGTFVCCYAVLNADDRRYVGYPEGIPQDTPFGEFFGRQSKHFLGDLGFDYLWLSNGFGFGLETWGVTGAVFNGKEFDTAKIGPVRDKILEFWKLFRKECPTFPIETRGTNLSTGMDLASDGVPLRAIYRGGFDMLPPPNSPWAALDGDFGLELVGYMSKIAELPEEDYPFRYYTHDPWWLNSPWLDRYGREPHDIYLPMSVSRINAQGETCRPSHIFFLTVDDSFGRMPVEVPNEVIPHILRARADSADQPGPIVWVYPFDEYHDRTFGNPPRVREVLFGDWFMRQAVNNGLPLNTVVSTRNLLSALKARPKLFDESVLMSIVPDRVTTLDACLLDHLRRGGKVMLYGPLERASDALLEALTVKLAKSIDGELSLQLERCPDELTVKKYPTKTNHRPLTCAGGIRATLREATDDSTTVFATVSNGNEKRVIALARKQADWKGGVLGWVRGTNSNYYRPGARLLATDHPDRSFASENLARFLLGAFGYDFMVRKEFPIQRTPIVCVTRRDNGFFFSGYHANTTVTLGLRFPQGAPLLIGFETPCRNGRTHYIMPRAWHRECRVFVQQKTPTDLSCMERHSGEYGVRRRLRVAGLHEATVRFYPERPDDRVRMYPAGYSPKKRMTAFPKEGDPSLGRHYVLEDVSGVLIIAW